MKKYIHPKGRLALTIPLLFLFVLPISAAFACGPVVVSDSNEGKVTFTTDVNEDIDGDGNLDVYEDSDGDGNLDVAEDVDGDGSLSLTAEDLDGNGNLDVAEDVDGDGNLDVAEDVDGDGTLFMLMTPRPRKIRVNGNRPESNLKTVAQKIKEKRDALPGN